MSDSLITTTDELPDPSSYAAEPAEAATVPDPAAYPPDLSALSLVELHVWHSRISGQLSQDLLDPAGPHPVTLDRQQELVAELDSRGNWLAPPGTAS